MPDKAPQSWKMPPLIKIYEALGALADGRVQLADEQRALVVSSDGAKIYEVELRGQVISANDNASYWQGYLGYPAIAVMIARGLLPADPAALTALRGIPWKELNNRFHNDYGRTLEEVARRLELSGASPRAVEVACAATLAALQEYAPLRGVRRYPARRRTATSQ
jgi:hypothetical protein